MSPWKERRLLAALSASEGKSIPSAQRRLVVHVAIWFTLMLLFFVVFQFYGAPRGREWVWVAGSFIMGVAVGIHGVFDTSREQWSVLRRYIDFGRVRARLSEFEN